MWFDFYITIDELIKRTRHIHGKKIEIKAALLFRPFFGQMTNSPELDGVYIVSSTIQRNSDQSTGTIWMNVCLPKKFLEKKCKSQLLRGIEKNNHQRKFMKQKLGKYIRP